MSSLKVYSSVKVINVYTSVNPRRATTNSDRKSLRAVLPAKWAVGELRNPTAGCCHTSGALGRCVPLDEAKQGRRYSQKMVEVFYVVEGDVIVVVAVYVFFGKWESRDENRV